ncbi:MAG: uroporphyrinogen-III synthase [Candidatus Nitrosopolaris sp.]
MSLSGLVVVVTGSRRASELARIIRSFGGIPYVAPTIGIEVNQRINEETGYFVHKILKEKVDYAVFMTGPGVYSLMATARNLGMEKELIQMLQQVTVVARSLKPKDALAMHGIKTKIVPEDNTSTGVAQLLRGLGVAGKRVFIVWHGSYSSELKTELEAEGAHVFELSTYKYSTHLKENGSEILKTMGYKYIPPEESKVLKLIEDMSIAQIGAITFTSPPAARELFKIASQHGLNESLRTSLNRGVIVVAIGPSTQKALEENDVHVDVMPTMYKIGSMIKSLCDYLDCQDSPKMQKTF